MSVDIKRKGKVLCKSKLKQYLPLTNNAYRKGLYLLMIFLSLFWVFSSIGFLISYLEVRISWASNQCKANFAARNLPLPIAVRMMEMCHE